MKIIQFNRRFSKVPMKRFPSFYVYSDVFEDKCMDVKQYMENEASMGLNRQTYTIIERNPHHVLIKRDSQPHSYLYGNHFVAYDNFTPADINESDDYTGFVFIYDITESFPGSLTDICPIIDRGESGYVTCVIHDDVAFRLNTSQETMPMLFQAQRNHSYQAVNMFTIDRTMDSLGNFDIIMAVRSAMKSNLFIKDLKARFDKATYINNRQKAEVVKRDQVINRINSLYKFK